MSRRSAFATAVAGLLLLTACPAGGGSASTDPNRAAFLVTPGEVVRLDEHHRISLAAGYHIVHAFADAPWLFFRRADGLMATDFSGADPVRIPTTRGHRGATGTRAWSADGTRLFDFEGQVISVDLRTLAVTELTRLRGWGSRPEWLPGHVFMPVKYFHDAGRDRLIVLLDRFCRPPVGSGGSGRVYPGSARTVAVAIDLARGVESVLFTDPESARSWAACPIRRRIYVSFDDRLEIRDLDGVLLDALHVPQLSTSALTVSPDGSRLLAEGPYVPGLADQGFSIHDARNGALIATHAVGGAPRWGPAGERVAFVRNHAELWLYEWRTDTASPVFAVDTCVSEAHSYGSPPAWSADGRFLAVHVSASRGRWQHTWYTMVVDLRANEMVIIDDGWLHLSWLPAAVGRFD